MILLGADPGFASFGIAVVRLEAEHEEVLHLDVIRTEPSAKRRRILATEDNLRRAREISGALRPFTRDAGAVAAEAMSFPRSSSVAGKMCLAWGVIATLADERGLPILQASPQEVKRALCGSPSASKDEIATALAARYPEASGLLAHLPRGQHEHAWDALAAVFAALGSEAVRLARRPA